MESEMTTAEMVGYMRDEAGKIGLVADALRGGAPTSARVADSRSANYAAIADRLEALESLYAKAWAEIEAHRDYPTDDEMGTGDVENENVNIIRMARLGTAMDDHDAARKEAGL